MQHTSELERMATLLAMSADIMRTLGSKQTEAQKSDLDALAETIEEVAERLIDLLFPKSGDQH